jgi:hypothetical protein
MQSAKKIVLIPASRHSNYQIGGGEPANSAFNTLISTVEPKKDKIKSKIYDKVHKLLKIIMKLARHVGYDDDLKIKLKNGKYLEKSNIVDLLTHAMSMGKVLYGESEFIDLLHSAGVNPDLIINENVKNKLISKYNRREITEDKEEPMDVSVDRKKTALKRTMPVDDVDDVDDHSSEAKRKKINEDLNEEIDRNLETPSRATVIKSTKSLKRKADDSEKESDIREKFDSIDDEQIDQNLWQIPDDG